MRDRTRLQRPPRIRTVRTRRRPAHLTAIAVGALMLAGAGVLGGVSLLRGGDPPLPRVQTTPYADLAAARPDELRIHRVAAAPEILVFDYPSYLAQAVALNRVAALVEKRNLPRERVVTPAELERYIAARGGRFVTFYYGHNYDGTELARFFELAAADANVRLNPGERCLREALLAAGAIRRDGEGFAPGTGAAYAISLVSAAAPDVAPEFGARARRVALVHELGHAWYAVNADYHAYARAFWYDMLTPRERDGFRRFLAARSYDVSNEALVIDEAQAYLAFTPDARVVSDAELGLPDGRLAALRARFDPPAMPPWHATE